MSVLKLLLLGVVVALVGAYFLLDLERFFTLAYLQEVRGSAQNLVDEHPIGARLGYLAAYVVTAVSLPGATIMTLAGGAVFGLLWGVVLVSFASSVGATLAFLLSRIVLGEWVQHRFANELTRVNDGFEHDGNFYLFSLRMVPLFPFFVVNLVMGLTKMRILPFYLVSQIGMLAGTFVFVFAGTQLAEVERVEDVLSPGLIVALSLLGLFPILAKKTMGWVKAKVRQ